MTPRIQRFCTTQVLLRLAGMILLIGVGALVIATQQNRTVRKFPQREVVIFWHMWSAEWKGVVDRIIDRFNESQDKYEVVGLSLPPGLGGGDTDRKLIMAVAGGRPPDCMAQWDPVIPLWASEGMLTPLDELMTAEELKWLKGTLFPVAWKGGSYEGRLYGLATALNAFAIYYRPDHFREAGLDPDHFPETTEELLEIASKLDRYDKNGNLTRMGYAEQYTGGNSFPVWMAVFGGGLYDWNASHMLTNTPGNLRTLQWIQGPAQRYGYDRIMRFNAMLQTTNMGGLDWSFMRGAFSIVVDGQWRVEQIAKFAPELEYRTAPCPYPRLHGRKGAGWSNGNYNIIPRGARNPKGAWAFMRFWSGLDDPARAAEFNVWGGWLPPRQEIIDSPIYQAYLQKHPQFRTFTLNLASSAQDAYPPVPYQRYLADESARIVDSVTRASITPQEGIARLEQVVNRQESKLKALRKP